jgi:hypothetical protein
MKTIDGRILLGWMDREEAIFFLRELCFFDPQISGAEAETVWRDYSEKVQALAERKVCIPDGLQLSQAEAHAARTFRQRHRTSANVLEVIKVDPCQLIVHQLYVATGLSDSYAPSLQGKRGWIDECLTAERNPQATFRIDGEGPGFKSRRPDQTFQTFTAFHVLATARLESKWSPTSPQAPS